MKILKWVLVLAGIVLIVVSIYYFFSGIQSLKNKISILGLGIFALLFGLLIQKRR